MIRYVALPPVVIMVSSISPSLSNCVDDGGRQRRGDVQPLAQPVGGEPVDGVRELHGQVDQVPVLEPGLGDGLGGPRAQHVAEPPHGRQVGILCRIGHDLTHGLSLDMAN